jgi:hypothetical protein
MRAKWLKFGILASIKVRASGQCIAPKTRTTLILDRCVPCKESQRAFKHIWFLPRRKANAEKPKELEFLPTLDKHEQKQKRKQNE